MIENLSRSKGQVAQVRTVVRMCLAERISKIEVQGLLRFIYMKESGQETGMFVITTLRHFPSERTRAVAVGSRR